MLKIRSRPCTTPSGSRTPEMPEEARSTCMLSMLATCSIKSLARFPTISSLVSCGRISRIFLFPLMSGIALKRIMLSDSIRTWGRGTCRPNAVRQVWPWPSSLTMSSISSFFLPKRACRVSFVFGPIFMPISPKNLRTTSRRSWPVPMSALSMSFAIAAWVLSWSFSKMLPTLMLMSAKSLSFSMTFVLCWRMISGWCGSRLEGMPLLLFLLWSLTARFLTPNSPPIDMRLSTFLMLELRIFDPSTPPSPPPPPFDCFTTSPNFESNPTT
mmetsp:Transcript_9323/g.16907  ORF Transcript_9323/g.16907 Transcript_9323/m.16907 type:complete len:270 (-) Transcript_9323:665-1474(-)